MIKFQNHFQHTAELGKENGNLKMTWGDE